MAEVIWEPSPEVLERANVVRFMRRHGFDDYREFQQRSQDDPDWFWPAAIEDMDLDFRDPWSKVVDLSRGPEWATWFDGGKLNIAWNCVHRWAQRTPEAEAAVFRGENGDRRIVTFAELSREVTRFAEGLAALGVGAGDAVALCLPMSLEVAIASHACAHLGAIQVPVFSGFAAPAVAARLVDSEAKVVVTADAFAEVIHQLLTESRSGEVPALVHLAASGDAEAIAGRIVGSDPTASLFRQLMLWSIFCSEPWAEYDVRDVARLGRLSYLGRSQVGFARNVGLVCSMMPRRSSRSWEEGPVRSTTPAVSAY